MMAFWPIRALGAKPLAPPTAKLRLSDPLGDAITHHLIGEKLWRYGASMDLTRDGRNLTLRIYLPEHRQCDRDLGRTEAHRIKDELSRHLSSERHSIRFADAWWSEKGRKEWVVLVKARAVG